MTDRYTKAVLTVIAAALVVLAVQNGVKPAEAAPYGCGSTSNYPCYVATSPRFGLAVTNAFGGDGKLLPLQVTTP